MEPRNRTLFRERSQKTRLQRFGMPLIAGGIVVLVGVAGFFAPSSPIEPIEPVATTTPVILPASTSSPAVPMPEPLMPSHIPVATPSESGSVGLSVAETLTGLSASELSKQLDDMQALHTTWIRLDFDWAVIQRGGPDFYDWSRVDRVVAATNKRGFKLLPILAYTPRWARSEDCSVRCPPTDPATFAHFAAVAAERYAPQGVHTWEIWNEPNVASFWRPGADPVQYAALLKATYLNIKNVDPTAEIISGGLAATDSRGGNMPARDFLSGIYAAGAGPYFTAVGMHPYSFPVTASYNASWNAWQQMANTNPSLRDIMIANGDRDKKIWITEYGAPTGGPGEASAAYDPHQSSDHVTEGRQKEMLVDAIADAAKHDWLGPFFWYSYKDIGTSQSSTENFYGIIRADGSHKPAYDALHELLK